MKHSINDPLPKRPAYDWTVSRPYDDESEWDRPLTTLEHSFWRGVMFGAMFEAGVVVLVVALWWLWWLL